MSRSFDPRPHLRQLANGAPHLDVKWRLHWLRSEHPDAQIDTNLVSVEGDVVICRVSVRLPDGGSAAAHGAASRSGGVSMADLIERAEQRALGRALANLGFGAQYLDEDAGVASRPAQAPTQQAAPPPVPSRDIYEDAPPPTPSADAPPRQRAAAESARTYDDSQPRQERTPRERDPRDRERERGMETRQPRVTADRERVDRGERYDRPERAERPARPERDDRYEPQQRQQRPERVEQREPDDADAPVQMPPMRRGSELRGHDAPRMNETPAREDVAWQRFWEWARARGYRDAEHLRELLGVEVLALTPREVRDLIRRYELDHQPGVEDEL
jgi:hypothetical protein